MSTLPIDHEKLEEYRTLTTVSGVYLEVWAQVLKDKRMRDSLADCLVRFSENDTEFLIDIIRPRPTKILGGGDGRIKVDKKTREIILFTYAR
ncbi:hypothetical protein [Litoribacillus peritrichatus]|uniref:Uncharacterized protein n=1 Tax=Litoribacillus peritrichatus TaxID=718191 RepID=A0ABP7MDY7_9GAMM